MRVARPFTFETFEQDGLFTYRYVGEAESLFERHWPGLLEEWGQGPTPYSEYGISDREDEAVYLGLVWRLTEGLVPYGVPRFDRDRAMYAAGAPYALINWEFEVENEGEIRGFVPARSWVRLGPPPSLWEREHDKEAGLFELPVFPILRDVVKVLQADVTGELNVYALEQWTVDEVVRALRGDGPPRAADFLGSDEMLMDLVIGVDEGWHDILVIQSPRDRADDLLPLVSEYEEAIERYEDEIDEITDTDDFLRRIGELLNLGLDGEMSRWAQG